MQYKRYRGRGADTLQFAKKNDFNSDDSKSDFDAWLDRYNSSSIFFYDHKVENKSFLCSNVFFINPTIKGIIMAFPFNI